MRGRYTGRAGAPKAPAGSEAAMYTLIQRALPARGKERECRSITEDFVKASQAAGVRMGMSVRIFSSMGSAIEVIATHPDLAALDKTRKERASATREVVQAVHQLSREPIRQRIY